MITQRSVLTFEAKIYVGLRKGYTEEIQSIELVREVCRDAVAKGWCLTLTPTEFIYTPTYTVGKDTPVDSEPGVIVGVINYPRFPAEPAELKARMIELAKKLLEKLGQLRVSVVVSGGSTIMLETTAPPV